MRLVKEPSGCNLIVVYELLRHGADVNQVDESYRTPLHYSVSNPNLIELLLHFNASITSLDSNNDSVLHSAARSGDPLSLSFLLVKVFIESPDLMEARNKQKKKFYDLFRSRDQVLIYNRFKELKGLKLKPRTPSSNQNELDQQDVIKALMVLNDVNTLRRLKLEKFSQEVNLPLCLSEQVKRLIYKTKPPRKRGRSRTVKSVTRIELECQFLSKFAKIPSSVNLETILQSEDFSKFNNLVDNLGCSKDENPFNIFNYACSLLDEKSVLALINSMQPRLKRGDIKHSTIDPIDSLKRFHPNLMAHFAAQLQNEEICSICKEPDAQIDQEWTKLVCRHRFHTSCLKEWFRFCWEKTCPMCRRMIYTEIK